MKEADEQLSAKVRMKIPITRTRGKEGNKQCGGPTGPNLRLCRLCAGVCTMVKQSVQRSQAEIRGVRYLRYSYLDNLNEVDARQAVSLQHAKSGIDVKENYGLLSLHITFFSE